MLFSLLTVGVVTEECTSWTVRVWVEGCCTDKAEFTFGQSHWTWSGREWWAPTVSATPHISWAATRSSTCQHMTGFIRRTTRWSDGHSRRTICRVVFLYYKVSLQC